MRSFVKFFQPKDPLFHLEICSLNDFIIFGDILNQANVVYEKHAFQSLTIRS